MRSEVQTHKYLPDKWFISFIFLINFIVMSLRVIQLKSFLFKTKIEIELRVSHFAESILMFYTY